jgi:UDP-N-acetyl-D-mannosaminuronic acid dehydrogenase
MKFKEKSISVIGLGYIGLPTAALLASKGYTVKGMDINKHAVTTINKGDIHIIEPELDKYVKSSVASGNLSAFEDLQPADIYIICVPTPFHNSEEIPTPNTDYVVSATKKISKLIKNDDIVILESTSPVGTTDMIKNIFDSNQVNTEKVYIGYCPERVLPGKIMKELVENARVIGGINEDSTEEISNFYKTFVKGEILKTKARIAEMCKLTENSYRDVNIAFANELSIICEKNKIDVWELINLANHHPRVNILQPGTGVGGHCIAVDPWFIVSKNPKETPLIKTARNVNDNKPKWVINKIETEAGYINTKKIACFGLSFKPDIDDLRESPAIKVVNSLIEKGYDVVCVEPNIESHDTYELRSIDEAIEECEVISILVKHKEFELIDVNKFRNKTVINFCGP